MDRSRKGIQVVPLLYTYTVTILWHGFEPGYPISFICWAFHIYSQKTWYTTQLNGAVKRTLPWWVYTPLLFLYNMYIVFFIGTAFELRYWSLIRNAWGT
jgi:hypothetical protein